MSNFPGKIKIIFWITLCWTILALARFGFAYVVVTSSDCNIENENVGFLIMGSVLTGVLAGILGGSGIVFLWEGWLRTKTYIEALLLIMFSYSIIYLLVAIPVGLFGLTHAGESSSFEIDYIFQAIRNLAEISTLESYLFWLSIVIITLIVLLVSDKYGPGVFMAFLLGKYFHPKREDRIFMFLDLRSSTQIAEKLGEEKYFSFLKDLFIQITAPILLAKGEIYQYVGDEVVITWPTDKGLKNNNCISCFFNIQAVLKKNKNHFINKYGVEPTFKAGIHHGHVMAGEIGVIKRDIAFSGDVLNTTARIQSKCNDLGVNILVSDTLLSLMPPQVNGYTTKSMGAVDLRGKENQVSLYTIEN